MSTSDDIDRLLKAAFTPMAGEITEAIQQVHETKPWRADLPLPKGDHPLAGFQIVYRVAPLCRCTHARTVIDGRCTRCKLPIC